MNLEPSVYYFIKVGLYVNIVGIVKWQTCLTTYIHNWSLQPTSVRIIELVSHTTFIVCVNFYTYMAGPTI